MKSFYLTDTGKVRTHNEDSVVIVKNKDNDQLMVVADGMGGHSAGEVASNLATSYLVNSFNDNYETKFFGLESCLGKTPNKVYGPIMPRQRLST